VCISKDGSAIVVVKGDGLSLFEMADLLISHETSGGFDCIAALNLDGGPSVQIAHRDQGKVIEKDGLWKVGSVVAFVAKAAKRRGSCNIIQSESYEEASI